MTQTAEIQKMQWCLTGLLTLVVLGLLPPAAAWADGAQEPFLSPPAQHVVEARHAVRCLQVSAFGSSVNSAARPTPVAFGRKQSSLPDLSGYQDVHARKLRFFGFLLPMVEAENRRLADIRRRLHFVYEHVRWEREIPADDRAWLETVVRDFRIEKSDFSATDFWYDALLRVDGVPENLVLVQAANESAWGTSRFAREGNNLFGQWCFSPGCGIVPEHRPHGATYEVAEFSSVDESVSSYMRNLNTGHSYQLLREIRARMRGEDLQPDPAELAAGLTSYSERGLAYVDEIRAMLRHNEEVISEARSRAVSE